MSSKGPLLPKLLTIYGHPHPKNAGFLPASCLSSSLSSSTSSTSSSSDDDDETSADELARAQLLSSTYFNYEFCTCRTPLPEAYNPPKPIIKKPKPTGPRAGIWCGSPCCSVAHYFPQDSSAVQFQNFPLKPKDSSASDHVPTCCNLLVKNDELIFDLPDQGTMMGRNSVPFYNVGEDESPLGVKMVKPEERPQGDPDNNTYLLTIKKTDAAGNPAKLQLSLKIPRTPDRSVLENETAAQYAQDDYLTAKRGAKVGGRGSRASKKSETRGRKKSKKTSEVSKTVKIKTTKTSKVVPVNILANKGKKK